MTPLVLVAALAAGPPRSLPLLKPASPTALVALRVRGGAADQEMKQSDVDEYSDVMRGMLVAVRSLSLVLEVGLTYVTVRILSLILLTTKDHGWGAILSFWNDVPRPVFFLYVTALVGALCLRILAYKLRTALVGALCLRILA